MIGIVHRWEERDGDEGARMGGVDGFEWIMPSRMASALVDALGATRMFGWCPYFGRKERSWNGGLAGGATDEHSNCSSEPDSGLSKMGRYCLSWCRSADSSVLRRSREHGSLHYTQRVRFAVTSSFRLYTGGRVDTPLTA